MDIKYQIGAAVILFLYLLLLFGLGCHWFARGTEHLENFDPDYDGIGKKHSAILDVILGVAFMLFVNAFFWLFAYTFLAAYYNLPIFFDILP